MGCLEALDLGAQVVDDTVAVVGAEPPFELARQPGQLLTVALTVLCGLDLFLQVLEQLCQRFLHGPNATQADMTVRRVGAPVPSPRVYRSPGGSAALRLAAAGVVAALVACGGGGDGAGQDLPLGLGAPQGSTPHGPPPTLAGQAVLEPVDPVTALVGDGLSFGAPLPSTERAVAELQDAPETAGLLVRRVHDTLSARHLADLAVVTLEGTAFHDEPSVDVWVVGLVGSLGGGTARTVEVSGRPAVRSSRDGRAVVAFRSGDLLAVVRGGAADADWVAASMLQAMAAGAEGRIWPETPVVDLPSEVVFVEVPGVAFVPFPPPDVEPPPVGPLVAGMLGADGRIGVVGGERRTTVWSIPTDAQTYPTAEALLTGAEALASSRSGGSPVRVDEVGGRLVAVADGAEEQPSARVFGHGRLLVLVEGPEPAQLDAVVSAWIEELVP